MKVGDLVKWENAGGEYELGIVLSVAEPINVMVYFPQEGLESVMTRADLEIIS